MTGTWLEGRCMLFTSGPRELLASAQRHFRDAGVRAFLSGEIDSGSGASGGTLDDAEADCLAVRGHDITLDMLIVCALWKSPLNEDEIGTELYRVVDYLKAAKEHLGSFPRYVVIIVPRVTDTLAVAGAAAAKTLCGYLTTHLLNDDIRINLILSPRSKTGMQRAADATFALCSGLLDDMRGQTLNISEA